MTAPNTQSTTHTNKRERQSCGAPHGTTRAFLWRDLKELLGVLLAAFAAGLIGGVFFMGQQLGLFG